MSNEQCVTIMNTNCSLEINKGEKKHDGFAVTCDSLSGCTIFD
jgi:hypothetical protein